MKTLNLARFLGEFFRFMKVEYFAAYKDEIDKNELNRQRQELRRFFQKRLPTMQFYKDVNVDLIFVNRSILTSY